MTHDETQREPLEIEVFIPKQVDLIDPNRPTAHRNPHQQPRPFRSRKRLALILFLVTCATTFLAGMLPGAGHAMLGALLSGDLFRLQTETLQAMLLDGLTFSGCLLLILLFHEMGHYLQARRYHVPATYPFFIPMPFSPFGTMGAVIMQGAGVANRKQMFDIAISGPLAGLVIALPVTFWGLQNSVIFDVGPQQMGTHYGDPLILRWMASYVLGPIGEGQEIQLNAMLFAGWVGIFVTALNLIPIGQLDGGHILYTLIGKRAHLAATGLLWGMVIYMMWTGNLSYLFIVILLMLFGPKHPPTADDTVPLGLPRVILGWLTLAFIFIGFTPTPIISMPAGEPPPRPPARERAEPDGFVNKEQDLKIVNSPREISGELFGENSFGAAELNEETGRLTPAARPRRKSGSRTTNRRFAS